MAAVAGDLAVSGEFAGALTERVALEQWQGDPEGGAWVADGEAWAALVPHDALAPVVGEGQASRPRYRLTIRTGPAVTLASRFLWRGRVLAVLRLEPDTRTPDRQSIIVEDRG